MSTAGIRTFNGVVKDLLVPVEAGRDHHGTDQAFITGIEFDVLHDRGATSEEAFDSFVAYMAGHKYHLPEEKREMILTCADSVAHSMHGVGSHELPLLIELRKQLR